NRAYRIFDILQKQYPDARVLLTYNNPFELLVATLLAAQCTDERVNQVTPKLFERFPDPRSMSQADSRELENIIKPTGFYRNKAKSLKKMASGIAQTHGNELPRDAQELSKLPGIGRKTANVVVANCFDVPSIIVDTHVKRVSVRLGLSTSNNTDKIEKELQEIIEYPDRTRFSYTLNFQGRYICRSQKPACRECNVENLCSFQQKNL
ncbi:MAG: endonuclease III, partial [Spirochaetota bacterium]